MRKFTTQASQEAYNLADDILETIEDNLPGEVLTDEQVEMLARVQNLVAEMCEAALREWGDERFEDGQSAGEESGYEEGYNDAVKEYAPTAANRSPMAHNWQARFAFAAPGLVAVHDADREAGTLALIVGEWDAWAILRAVEGAEVRT